MIVYILILLIILIISGIGIIYYLDQKGKNYLYSLDQELLELSSVTNFVSETNGLYKLKPEAEINEVLSKIKHNNEVWTKAFNKRTASNSSNYDVSSCSDKRQSLIRYLSEDLASLVTSVKLSIDNSHLSYFYKKFNYNKVFFPPDVMDFNKIESSFKTPEVIQLDAELMELAKITNFFTQDENNLYLRKTEDLLKLQDVIHLNINNWNLAIEKIMNSKEQYTYDHSGYKEERRGYGEAMLTSLEKVLRDENNPDISSPQNYLKRFVGEFQSKYDFKTCSVKCRGVY